MLSFDAGFGATLAPSGPADERGTQFHRARRFGRAVTA